MKKIIMLAAVCCAALQLKASFRIQLFNIPANQNKNLVVDPSKPTTFKATYNLSYLADNMFNTIEIDVVYISNDQRETLVLGKTKTYTAASGASSGIADYIDATLPANKTAGRISLRLKSYSPQTTVDYSFNSYGVEIGTPSGGDAFKQKMHEYRVFIEPRGNIEYLNNLNPPASIANTSWAPVYITITADGKAYDLYIDPTRAPGLPYNNQVTPGYYTLRKEFYAFTQQPTANSQQPTGTRNGTGI